MRFPKATEMAHRLVGERLTAGAVTVDATAGNGHDTLFLAGRVGAAGIVYAFDVQRAALDETTRRLATAGEDRQLRLRAAGHETMTGEVAPEHRGRLAAVMFNLGYLPGGDKSKTTCRETTLSALGQALELLAPAGLMTVVCYPGHPAGAGEASAVARFLGGLEQVDYRVLRYGFENLANAPPFLLAVEKAG